MRSVGNAANILQAQAADDWEVFVMVLSELERAILNVMCQRMPEHADALSEQLEQLVVISRENTGAGFYAQLEADPRAHRIEIRVIGGVFAKIEGLNNPVAFVLFFKDGRVDTLEGAATEESTARIDLSNVKFDVLK